MIFFEKVPGGAAIGLFMNITSSDVILLAHATFGVLGTLSALWVFVEALNGRDENAGRIQKAALLVAASMVVAGILGAARVNDFETGAHGI